MTSAAPSARAVPFPDRGDRVLLDGLPGGPWSSLVEGLGDRMLILDPPRLDGRVVGLPLGRSFVLAYTLREIQCEVDAELVTGPGADGSGTYAARLIGDGRRLQRRNTLRVAVHLIVQASVGGGQEEVSCGGITENLSAGGALLRVDWAVEVGSPLTTTVDCGGDTGAIDIPGRVVRCDRLDTGERRHRVAVAFLDMPHVVEDRLGRFVFERQREMRRREHGLA
jgi:hypothetical protein